MVFIALSVIILLGGVVGAILLGTQIEILTSAASIVSGLISTLFLAQLRRSQDLNKENVGRLEGRFQEALQQLIELSTTEA
jgi:LytS/YehU family sensor histidine kinase